MMSLRRSSLRCSCVIGAAMLVAPGVYAQATGAPQDPTALSLEQLLNTEVQTVFGASRFEQRVIDAPASVTIVTRDEIRRYGYRTLAEILQGVRGFYVTYDRNYTYLGVRGFGRPGDYNTRVLFLVDGHRLNDNVYDSTTVGTEFPIDVTMIERVEVVRGPTSSLYGPSAFFAVINVVTRSASSFNGIEVDAEAGSQGMRGGRIDGGHVFDGGTDVSFGASAFDSDGASMLHFPLYDGEPGTGIANGADEDRAWRFAGTVVRGPWRLQGVAASRRKTVPTGAFGTVIGDPGTWTRDARGYVDLTYHGALAGVSLQWRSAYDRNTYDGRYLSSDGEGGSAVEVDSSRGEWLSTELTGSKRIGTAHLWTGGLEYRDNLRQDQDDYDAVSGRRYVSVPRASQVWAAYAEDEFRIAAKVIVNAGLRFDHHDRFGNSTNPRVALIVKPREVSSLKLLYGTAFRAPNVYEQYYFNNGDDPLLKPERVRTAEAVWDQYLAHRFRVSGSVFRSNITGLISQIADEGNLNGIGYGNTGAARTTGAEVEVEGSLAAGYHGLVSCTVQSARNAETGDRLSNAPSSALAARATGPLFHDRVVLGIEGVYIGARRTLADTAVDGVFLTNLTITGGRLPARLGLSFSIRNLFDRRYSDPAGEEHRGDAIPQDGRVARANVSWRF